MGCVYKFWSCGLSPLAIGDGMLKRSGEKPGYLFIIHIMSKIRPFAVEEMIGNVFHLRAVFWEDPQLSQLRFGAVPHIATFQQAKLQKKHVMGGCVTHPAFQLPEMRTADLVPGALRPDGTHGAFARGPSERAGRCSGGSARTPPRRRPSAVGPFSGGVPGPSAYVVEWFLRLARGYSYV